MGFAHAVQVGARGALVALDVADDGRHAAVVDLRHHLGWAQRHAAGHTASYSAGPGGQYGWEPTSTGRGG